MLLKAHLFIEYLVKNNKFGFIFHQLTGPTKEDSIFLSPLSDPISSSALLTHSSRTAIFACTTPTNAWNIPIPKLLNISLSLSLSHCIKVLLSKFLKTTLFLYIFFHQSLKSFKLYFPCLSHIKMQDTFNILINSLVIVITCTIKSIRYLTGFLHQQGCL